MKKISILICLLCLSISLLAENSAMNESLRLKIEKLQNNHILANNYEIYCTPSLREVYLNNGFDSYWNDREDIYRFINAIERSKYEGLNPEDYHLSDIRNLVKGGTKEDKVNLDIVLSDAFLLYSSHLLTGKTNPVTINAEWHVLKTDRDPLKYFYRIGHEDVQKILDDVSPSAKEYLALKSILREYKLLEKSILQEEIGAGAILKPGMSDPRVPAIRKALTFFGDYAMTSGNNESESYDKDLQSAVIEFQKRMGLEALGTIGIQTIEAINIRFTDRIKTIEVNLERLRWLPNELPNYYIVVNISNFELEMIRDNQQIAFHKVIVGKPFRKTPVFSSLMEYIVFNPTWTVPSTILKNDILPETRKNPAYLEGKRIRVFDAQGNLVNIHQTDWSSSKVFSYTYRQDPGVHNALGAVKFMFPNKYSVYLHDTPNKELFDKTERAFSSGCIRVQNPLKLAGTLLADQPGYDMASIEKIVENGKTQTVMLKNKPNVFFIYLTAWVNNNEQLHLRKDIYERDQALYKALHEKPVYDIR